MRQLRNFGANKPELIWELNLKDKPIFFYIKTENKSFAQNRRNCRIIKHEDCFIMI